MDIFELATRNKFRFSSFKGDLTTEDLWDLPLTSRSPNGVDLDTVARAVNSELKSVTEETFVSVRPDPRKDLLQSKLDILKHVIAVKIKAQEDAKAAVARAEKRRKLLEALESKDNEVLAAASREDILKQLAELDGAAA